MWNPFKSFETGVVESGGGSSEEHFREEYLKKEKAWYSDENIEGVTDEWLREKYARRQKYVAEQVGTAKSQGLPVDEKYYGELFDNLHRKDRPESPEEAERRKEKMQEMEKVLQNSGAVIASGENLSAKIRHENTNQDELHTGSRGARTPDHID